MDQAAVNAAMGPWGDVEFSRFALRVGLFRRRGATAAQAEQWADRLALRDQQLDDRRVCIECAHRQNDGGCFPASQGRIRGVTRDFKVIPFLLQRCGFFQWQKP
jgi:hypothetical protein